MKQIHIFFSASITEFSFSSWSHYYAYLRARPMPTRMRTPITATPSTTITSITPEDLVEDPLDWLRATPVIIRIKQSHHPRMDIRVDTQAQDTQELDIQERDTQEHIHLPFPADTHLKFPVGFLVPTHHLTHPHIHLHMEAGRSEVVEDSLEA